MYTVMGCGTSILGQIGQAGDSSIPTLLAFKNVVDLQAGGWTTCLLQNTDQVSFLGCNKDGQIPQAQTSIINTPLTPSQIKKAKKNEIGCADYFTAVINQDEVLSIHGKFYLPDKIKDLKFSKIFAKYNWFAGITKTDNKLFVVFNELDLEGNQKLLTFSELILKNTQINPESIVSITSYTQSKIAILSDAGYLYVFEKLESNNDKTIELEPKFPNLKIVSVASTRTKSIILNNDGRVFEVVDNNLELVSGYNGLPISLFAGGATLGMLTYQGDCYMWGCGTHGQLGNGSFLNYATPQKVNLEDSLALAAAAGEEHTVFLTAKKDSFAVLLPKLMKDQFIPFSISMMETIPNGFNPPEFDVKF